MTDGFFDGDVFKGLAFRILLFLSLALLPFGVISVVQTQEIARQAERSAELSLLGLTEQAANAERAAIQEAFGAASALSAATGLYQDNPQSCSSFLAEYRDKTGIYAHLGYLTAHGRMDCTSAMRPLDASELDAFDVSMTDPARSVVVHSQGPLSNRPVLVVNHPFERDGDFAGYMTLSIPLATVRGMLRPVMERQPYDLVTFNARGDLLISDRGVARSATELPSNRSLKALVGAQSAVFRDENADGQKRVYSVVPIVANVAYSMSVWREADILAMTSQSGLNVFLPLLMWLASLIVAFWSLNRLALRHIRKLGRQMRLFAFNRSMPKSLLGRSVPRELVEMQKDFLGMAESIIRDEAALEDSLRDKNILLKEVHHRVKNNLQLISSIMNMQIRRAQTEDERLVLKRLQERILSLATVHKNLYQTEALDQVDAGALVEEIVGQLLVVGLPAGARVEVTQHFDHLKMDADDAAPLTMLVSEAVTNAMKYIGKPADREKPTLEISMRKTGDNQAVFSIINSTRPHAGSEGTGLGSQLINAFARQLNAEVKVAYEAGLHMLSLTFPISVHNRQRTDY